MAVRGWLCSLHPLTFSPVQQGSPVTCCAQPPSHYAETNMSPHPLPQNSTLPKMISQVGGWNKKGWFELYDKPATALLDSTGHPAAQNCPSRSK